MTSGNLSTLLIRLEEGYETEQRLFHLVHTDWQAAGMFSYSEAAADDDSTPVSYLVFQRSDPE